MDRRRADILHLELASAMELGSPQMAVCWRGRETGVGQSKKLDVSADPVWIESSEALWLGTGVESTRKGWGN